MNVLNEDGRGYDWMKMIESMREGERERVGGRNVKCEEIG